MKWQGSSSDHTSSVPGPGGTVKVPLMYRWTANLEMVVNRAEKVLVLPRWISETLAVAADEKSSLTITGMLPWTRRWKLLVTTAHRLWTFQSRQTPNRGTPRAVTRRKTVKVCGECA